MRVAIATTAMGTAAILIGHRVLDTFKVSSFEDTRNLWFSSGNKNSKGQDYRNFNPSKNQNGGLDETKVINLSEGDKIIYDHNEIITGDLLIYLTQNKCGTPSITHGFVTRITPKTFFVSDVRVKKDSRHYVKIVPTMATKMNLSL